MLKWLMNNDATTDAKPTGSAAASIPTPPALPTPQPRVMFVQPSAGTPNTASTSATLPPPAPAPLGVSTPPQPSMPTPSYLPPLTPSPVVPTTTIPTPPLPEKAPELPTLPTEPITPPLEEEEKSATIEMSNPISRSSEEPVVNPGDLFAEAFEKTSAEEVPAPELPPVEPKNVVETMVATEAPAEPQVEATPIMTQPLPAMPGSLPTMASAAPELDLPDVSAEIKRILQERWITLANQQLEKLASRRDEIAMQLSELENQQRELSTKKQTLESEKVELMHTSEGWDAKLKEAQSTLDKVVQEVSAI